MITMTSPPTSRGFSPLPHLCYAPILIMMYIKPSCFLSYPRNGWEASLGSPFPLLAQELLELLHELLRVKVAVTLWARHLVYSRIIGLF